MLKSVRMSAKGSFSNFTVYSGAIKGVADAKNALKKKTKSGKHRSLHNRVFPPHVVRAMALRAGILRLSKGVVNGEEASPDDNAYNFIDYTMFAVMNSVLYDAATITISTGKKTISERDVLKSLAMRGSMGHGSEVGRRRIGVK